MASKGGRLVLKRRRAKGRAKGRAEGRAEGRAKGRLDGERRVLLRQLRKRFGTIPMDVEKRVASATEAELEAWTDRVLGAATLDEVFPTDAA